MANFGDISSSASHKASSGKSAIGTIRKSSERPIDMPSKKYARIETKSLYTVGRDFTVVSEFTLKTGVIFPS